MLFCLKIALVVWAYRATPCAIAHYARPTEDKSHITRSLYNNSDGTMVSKIEQTTDRILISDSYICQIIADDYQYIAIPVQPSIEVVDSRR